MYYGRQAGGGGGGEGRKEGADEKYNKQNLTQVVRKKTQKLISFDDPAPPLHLPRPRGRR